MTAPTPLLALDVDGPLNPFNAPPGALRGYETRYLSGLDWGPGGVRVRLSPLHGWMLRELTPMVELVWATAWQDMANRLVAPVLRLPDLPVIRFPRRRPTRPDQIWKRAAVEQYADGRPLAWLDDEFALQDYAWGRLRTEAGLPTFLRYVDPAVGLTRLDVDLIADWALGLQAPAATATGTAERFHA